MAKFIFLPFQLRRAAGNGKRGEDSPLHLIRSPRHGIPCRPTDRVRSDRQIEVPKRCPTSLAKWGDPFTRAVHPERRRSTVVVTRNPPHARETGITQRNLPGRAHKEAKRPLRALIPEVGRLLASEQSDLAHIYVLCFILGHV